MDDFSQGPIIGVIGSYKDVFIIVFVPTFWWGVEKGFSGNTPGFDGRVFQEFQGVISSQEVF